MLSGAARVKSFFGVALLMVAAGLPAFLAARPTLAQDPAEPPGGAPTVKVLPRPAGAIRLGEVSERALRRTIQGLVACGTRHSLSSWNNPERGIGCGRDLIAAEFQKISRGSGGRLRVVVDHFEAAAGRTGNQAVPLENVYAILPGSDPARAKSVFIVSGHFDSRASDPMDPASDAPGADDDGSGTAVSIECARLLSAGHYRATLVFAAVSGEEQGLLGGTRLLQYFRQHGYKIGGMLDNDIVGADFTPGAPHRARVFSGGGREDDCDSPSRELARAVEEIDGRQNIRMIFRLDRLNRGGDHRPFVETGLPAVRFTEPLENYRHQHQTPRMEAGVQYGDLAKFLNFSFMARVARANAEALRELALAPAPPEKVRLTGAVEPSAKAGWSAPEDAERAGFEILWRQTTSPRWSVFALVRSAGRFTFQNVSTDDHFFAVRAVGKNGARSLAVPAAPPGGAAIRGK